MQGWFGNHRMKINYTFYLTTKRKKTRITEYFNVKVYEYIFKMFTPKPTKTLNTIFCDISTIYFFWL